MAHFGLIGEKLSHSFSKKYFTEKFAKLNLNHQYDLFELKSINEFSDLIKRHELKGLNVTIPYKEQIIPFLDELSEIAQEIGAVNTIDFREGKLIGHNTDYYGFKDSLVSFLNKASIQHALVLGNGGASKAICLVLKDLDISYQVVSRTGELTYDHLAPDVIVNTKLIINCTPLGTYPEVDDAPNIDYECLTKEHFCYDLVYNPKTTLFMSRAQKMGARTINGEQMLHGQAEKSWQIWGG